VEIDKQLSIMLSVDENGGFSKNGKIPWYSENYMEFLDTLTDKENTACVMGRNTYNTFLEEDSKYFDIFSNKDIFVVSSTESFNPAHGTKVSNLHQAQLLNQHNSKKVVVLGGRRLFIEALSHKPLILMGIMKKQFHQCDNNFNIEVLTPDKYKIAHGDDLDDCRLLIYEPA